MGMSGVNSAKPYCIAKRTVWEAYQQVKANRGAAGIDDETIAEFEQNLSRNLYKLWNRMSSGSYFPPPVKQVEIPKASGGTRKLGVPTVADRIAQTVVKLLIEPTLDPIFHEDSYGYRPGRSAKQAVAVTRKRCWQSDWVVEFDIKAAFDQIDHGLLEKAVRAHIKEDWILLYIGRWLRAPFETEQGARLTRDRGTPQGGVVTPRTQKRTCRRVASRGGLSGSGLAGGAAGRTRRIRYGVPDGDAVVVDDDLLDDQPDNALASQDVHVLGLSSQPVEEFVQRVGEPQAGALIGQLVAQRFQFRLQTGLALPQRGHAPAQLV
jgi:hypothetical protein